jgi:hypothetical protein
MTHTVELLEQAIDAARQVGFTVRQDWLTGDGSGHCLVRGRKMLLLDMAQPATEQLAAIRFALSGERGLADVDMSTELAATLDVRSVA